LGQDGAAHVAAEVEAGATIFDAAKNMDVDATTKADEPALQLVIKHGKNTHNVQVYARVTRAMEGRWREIIMYICGFAKTKYRFGLVLCIVPWRVCQ
jgi:hypothetical protein